MERSVYDQSNGLPTSQPYPPIPEQTPTTLAGPPDPYSQYSYDLHMRYAEDPNRQYSQDTGAGHPPQEVPRQYTSLNSPYARDATKDGPTSPYPKEIVSPYSRDSPTSPVAQSYPREMAPNTYPGPYPAIPAHYAQMPAQHHQGQGHPVQLPPMSMAMAGHPQDYNAPPQMVLDTTGQVAPSGMKPRVTATLWEDEGTLCFQVDVKGTCVARREDNHMINGTKLLNVAGMTRGRRDGILKAEKQKHVVKIGPMHLKGVWIPFDRALTFANKENITPLLYPLFVHNIGALLYHPVNNSRAGPGYNPASQLPRRQDENSLPTPPLQHQQHPQQQQQSPIMQHDPVMFNAARER